MSALTVSYFEIVQSCRWKLKQVAIQPYRVRASVARYHRTDGYRDIVLEFKSISDADNMLFYVNDLVNRWLDKKNVRIYVEYSKKPMHNGNNASIGISIWKGKA